jgi:peptidoglycan/LPS O-acetylase OafA/YrhL
MHATRLDGLLALRGLVQIGGKSSVPSAIVVAAEISAFAVELFFVTSAFSLCIGHANALATPKQIANYAEMRFWRIAPLFYVVMVIWNGALWAADGRIPSATAVLLNLSFTFGLSPAHSPGLVLGGWSIGVEMLFYVLFPILLLMMRDARSMLIGLCVSFSIGLLWHMAQEGVPGLPHLYSRANIVTQLPCFILGIGAYQFYRTALDWRDDRKRRFASVGLLTSIVWIGTVAVYWGRGLLEDASIAGYILRYAIVLAFPLVVVSLALYPTKVIVNRLFLAAGTASFSLYLTHCGPVIVMTAFRPLMAPIIDPGSWVETAIWLCLVAIPVAATAAVSYFVVERPTYRYGRSRAHEWRVARDYRALRLG